MPKDPKELESFNEKSNTALFKENQRQQRLLAEEQAALAAAQANAKPEDLVTAKKTTEYEVVGATGSDWEKILADYKKAYPKAKLDGDTLQFESRDDAVAFFTKQATATPPRTFFMREMVDGKETGFHLYSCGNGKMYQGTIDEIQKQLEAEPKTDLKAQTALESFKIMTNDAKKAALQELKKEVPDTPEASSALPSAKTR